MGAMLSVGAAIVVVRVEVERDEITSRDYVTPRSTYLSHHCHRCQPHPRPLGSSLFLWIQRVILFQPSHSDIKSLLVVQPTVICFECLLIADPVLVQMNVLVCTGIVVEEIHSKIAV